MIPMKKQMSGQVQLRRERTMHGGLSPTCVPYKRVSFAEITDGSSNTILLAEKSAWGRTIR